jgi:DNA polymerase-3 subunit delta
MIFFFYGPNVYAARQEIHRLRLSYITKTGSNLGFERLDGTRQGLQDLRSVLQTVPFLVTSRLIIVEGLGTTKPAADAFTKVLEAIPSSTVVVFYDSVTDSRTAYYNALLKMSRPVKFDLLNHSDLIEWLVKRSKQLGGIISRPAAQLLLTVCGDDQWRLEGELIKLISYQIEVTVETIHLMVVPSVTQSIFDLTEAMTAGRGRVALLGYQNLLSERVNEHYILTMVTWQLRNLLLAKSAGGITPSELSKVAGISPYAAGKAVMAAKGYNETTLRIALVSAAECEYRIKSGLELPERAIERLILEIAARR